MRTRLMLSALLTLSVCHAADGANHEAGAPAAEADRSAARRAEAGWAAADAEAAHGIDQARAIRRLTRE